jgi:hypothetical protein
MFIYGSNILKCYTKEKSHFWKSILCVACVRVLVFFSVIADISLEKFLKISFTTTDLNHNTKKL